MSHWPVMPTRCRRELGAWRYISVDRVTTVELFHLNFPTNTVIQLSYDHNQKPFQFMTSIHKDLDNCSISIPMVIQNMQGKLLFLNCSVPIMIYDYIKHDCVKTIKTNFSLCCISIVLIYLISQEKSYFRIRLHFSILISY